MIIKSLSRKTPEYSQLAHYMIGKGKSKTPLVIRHNMQTESGDPDELAREIEENAAYSRRRKNGICMYHEIVSFSPRDKAAITRDMLEDVSHEYMAERLGDCGLGFAAVHIDKENVHIHFMIGANQIRSRRKLRMSRAEFERLKMKMSGWVKDKYPQLMHTYDQRKRAKGKVRERQRENCRNYRLKKQNRKAPTRKQLARSAVVGAVKAAKSATDFIGILKGGGFTPYRRGKSLGIMKDGLRFRLSTLGVLEMAKELLEGIIRTGKNLEELKEIQARNEHERQAEQEQKQGRAIEADIA